MVVEVVVEVLGADQEVDDEGALVDGGFHWPGLGVVITGLEPSDDGVLGGRAHSG